MISLDIVVPDLPESISKATVATWHKKSGDVVTRDEVLVEIETDKIVLEIPALEDGILDVILKSEGTTVFSNQILGRLRRSNTCKKDIDIKSEVKKPNLSKSKKQKLDFKKQDNTAITSSAFNLESIKYSSKKNVTKKNKDIYIGNNNTSKDKRFMMQEHTKNLISESLEKEVSNKKFPTSVCNPVDRSEKRVLMTPLRKKISERLLYAKNSNAILTTFNEVNMKSIIKLRDKYSTFFEKRYGIGLSFMSFYIKAVVEALKKYPEINASIDGDYIVYYNYFDISIAVSTKRGLVTPVIRNVGSLGIFNIEKKIKELLVKAHSNKLTIEDLTGGNFTISNGGVFGSLMSTPIINPPQSAILGVHTINDRPMAVNGKVEILPMMYLALSYDHRLIDGRESVGFLVTVKELLEDTTLLLLNT